jgi:sRNA-binding regulator protein Hfq
MTEKKYELPDTFLKIVRKDNDYSIFLLEGHDLIFFPA